MQLFKMYLQKIFNILTEAICGTLHGYLINVSAYYYKAHQVYSSF